MSGGVRDGGTIRHTLGCMWAPSARFEWFPISIQATNVVSSAHIALLLSSRGPDVCHGRRTLAPSRSAIQASVDVMSDMTCIQGDREAGSRWYGVPGRSRPRRCPELRGSRRERCCDSYSSGGKVRLMSKAKARELERAGWKPGTPKEFLDSLTKRPL